MASLDDLKAEYLAARARFEAVLTAAFPGQTEWHWHCAVAHIDGQNVARNDDTSLDVPMAANLDIKAAWCAYIDALHEFYLLRDGPLGVLGAYPGITVAPSLSESKPQSRQVSFFDLAMEPAA